MESGGRYKGMTEGLVYRACPWDGGFPNEVSSLSGLASQVKGSSLEVSLLLACYWVHYIPDCEEVSCGDPVRGQQQGED